MGYELSGLEVVASKISTKELNELLRPHFIQQIDNLTNIYNINGKFFIHLFKHKEWFRMLCGFTVHEFEIDVPYEEKKEITEYVEKLKLDERQKKLLKRTLVMIWLINYIK